MGIEPLGIKETARGIDRTVNGQAILHPYYIVFLAVTGSGVDRAGSLLQRDVIRDHAK